MTTYPEMNEKIVDMLTFRGDSTSLYAAGRIEELETKVEQLETTREEQAETIYHLQSEAGSASYKTQKLLEQAQRAQRAEAAAREAVAREAMILTALRNLHNALMPYTENLLHGTTHCKFCGKYQGEWIREDARWKPAHHEECPIGQAISVLRNPSEATAMLLERLAELETMKHKIDEMLADAGVDDEDGALTLLEQVETVVQYRERYYITEDAQQCTDYIQGLQKRLAELETLPQQLENLSVATAVPSERLKQTETQVADLKADLARNARMLAQQCDQAREAEIQAAKAKREAANLRGALQAALVSLEAASGALTLPGEEKIDVATELIEEVIVAIQKGLA